MFMKEREKKKVKSSQKGVSDKAPYWYLCPSGYRLLIRLIFFSKGKYLIFLFWFDSDHKIINQS